MRIGLVLCVLFCLVAPAAGQEPVANREAAVDSKPILRTSLDKDSVIPGQSLTLRVEVLVPTFLPKPPVFPSFEVPNVMLRLPERASGPISETIDRETWAGVGRSYRLTPMVPGRFQIPSQTIKVTYADPETNEPIVVNLRTEPVPFAGALPPGTEDLDPFIAADGLKIEQMITGDPGALAPGGSVVRVVTTRIEGTSPLFVPPLIPPLESQEIASYPDEPALEETDDRGVLSGVRTERVTYVAEAGGRVTAPEISLRWFNVKTQQVESVTVPEIAFAISGPAPSAPSFDWRAAAPMILVGLVLLALAGWICRLLWPRIVSWRRRRREAWLASEAFAYRQAQVAIRGHRFNDAVTAVAVWSKRASGVQHRTDAALAAAMARLGEEIYGRPGRPVDGSPTDPWAAALKALRAARNGRRLAGRERGHVLPPLNPESRNPVHSHD